MTIIDMAATAADESADSDVVSREDLKQEDREWVEALEYVLAEQGPDRVRELLRTLLDEATEHGVSLPFTANTPYINTIAPRNEPEYPGDRAMERRIKSVVRWNAMAMVAKANRQKDEDGNELGLGGHISTFASSATLYEVAYNHFFRGRK